ncbi:LRR receptor-like serine/threonine-protein kinase EFR [Actinidia eriantha]|uniref:LRR receptor-like serine/threonine-protein kinase EFR n=1 Tax=Actinidia eriantha TaxID=165200 RepID=UPI002588DDB4|nr:LRR receptor-like serine/threonine-protein kinase EFR [Actinidia eriantha]
MTGPNITNDQYALLAFKARITLDPKNILVNNWTSDTSVCSWIGVVCTARHNRVAALNIPDMGLTGTISPSLGNLSFLVHLNITNNSFHGVLPKELANLCRLRFLHVAFNNFRKLMPLSIFNISTIESISFLGNGLSGNLPENLFYRLPKLKFLSLSLNDFYGKIPPSLNKCSELQILSLSGNKFTGPIPREIGNLTMLKVLYLGGNNLEALDEQLPRPQAIDLLASFAWMDLK